MATLHVNTDGWSLGLNDLPDTDLTVTLALELRRLPVGAPVVVLVHGFRYSPFDATENPHDHLFSLSPKLAHWKVLSWPRALGFSASDPKDGLCIGFGWHAMSRRLNQKRAFRDVYNHAQEAGRLLARLVRLIIEIAPDRRVDILSHSVGARVVFTALTQLSPGMVSRVILLGPAEYRSEARALMEYPAAHAALFYAVTSRENAAYDWLFETFGPIRGAPGIGRGGPQGRANWIDLRLDCAKSLEALARNGFDISPPDKRICHWSTYLRPGVFPFYQAILRDRVNWSVAALRRLTPQNSSETTKRHTSRALPLARLPRLP